MLTKIFIDFLLLALVFLKNFSTFNKKIHKFITCYNFNCRLVLDLYILFQSLRTVSITQKLGCNFKYNLHCIISCVIITLNRFLNLTWLINLSSFILFRLSFERGKSKKHSYSKSSWVLPVSNYLFKFFPSPFFINFLISIFKMTTDFMSRNFINAFLNCNMYF